MSACYARRLQLTVHFKYKFIFSFLSYDCFSCVIRLLCLYTSQLKCPSFRFERLSFQKISTFLFITFSSLRPLASFHLGDGRLRCAIRGNSTDIYHPRRPNLCRSRSPRSLHHMVIPCQIEAQLLSVVIKFFQLFSQARNIC